MTSADLNVYGFQSAYAPDFARMVWPTTPVFFQEAEDEDDAEANREKLREDLANEIKKDIEDASADMEIPEPLPDVADDIPNPTGSGKM